MRVALRHAARRSNGATETVVETGDLRVDLGRGSSTGAARRYGSRAPSTPRGLARAAGGKVLTTASSCARCGDRLVDETHYLRVYMAQLRHKLEDDPPAPALLTETGVGYRLKVD